MEEFLSIVRQVVKERDTGSFKEFMEAFKSFDREGQGYISLGEARHVLTSMGECPLGSIYPTPPLHLSSCHTVEFCKTRDETGTRLTVTNFVHKLSV